MSALPRPSLRQSLDDFAAELGRRVPSGSDFNYLATDTHVLSAVLRGAYGKPFLEIVQEKLWDRLGFAGDALWSQNIPGPEGIPFGHCCLATRLIDFAHLGELYLRDGVWNGERLVPEGFVEMAGARTRPSRSRPPTPPAMRCSSGCRRRAGQPPNGRFSPPIAPV